MSEDNDLLVTIYSSDLRDRLVEWIRNGFDDTDDVEVQVDMFVDRLEGRGA